MPTTICPNCNRRILYTAGDVDVQHECNSGKPAIDQEDVPVMGDWVDYTGSGIANNVNMQGVGDRLFGTRAKLEGGENEKVTSRGNIAAITRKRQHIEHIKLNGTGFKQIDKLNNGTY